MALKRKRIEDLAGVLEFLKLHEWKPRAVRVVAGAQMLEWVRFAFNIGRDIGERTRHKPEDE